ncbi:glutamate receptor 1-like isoform X2 [Amphibalanus amphitrite]|uniref:glutamate receptor 1-like isoform X2 n=1 Tax=Amphibalanus amphitrite TaxID=1232801 RepID=UPI001C927134|nr:glutamate receptor 1-like isoform X2 [Amphibalanus amphitrite]
MRPSVVWTATALLLFCHHAAAKQKIKLGVIFDTETDQLQSAMLAAMREQQRNPSLDFVLDPTVSVINTVNVYKISRLICDKVFSLGVHLMLGYVNPDAFDTLHSYANTFQMPFVAPWFPQKVRQMSTSLDYALSMRPEYHQAVLDIINHYRWDDVIYLYDSEDGLHRLQQMLQSVTPGNGTLRVRHAHRIFKVEDAISFLRQLELLNRWSVKRVVLDCSARLAKDVIVAHVKDVHLGRRNFHYLLSGLVMDEEWDNSTPEYGALNVTGLRLVDPRRPQVQAILQRWSGQAGMDRLLSAQTALMYDSVLVITEALRQLWPELLQLHQRRLKLPQPPGSPSAANVVEGRVFNCSQGFSDVTGYEHGGKIMKQLRKIEIEGLTGNISFSHEGKRKDYTLDVVEMSANSRPVKVGVWSDVYGFSSTPVQPKQVQQGIRTKNNTIIITTIEEPPFIMQLKGEDAINKTGNDLLVGYCKDLADLLAKEIGFTYEMRLVKDKRYGAVNTSVEGNWDGIIGELVRREADMAIAPLSISLRREQAVFFTKPFMTLGISIMIKKPIRKNPGFFSFLNPFSREIWLCVVFAYFGVSIVLFLVSRFSPYEWRLEETVLGTAVTNEFTIYNSLWFVLGSLLKQGSDISPRSISGRLVGACWWFFCLILVSSYTANLAAFLTVERLVTPINSVEELASQSDVEYGTMRAGATTDFFKNSKLGVYQRMWDFMSSNEHVFVQTYREGIERVRNSKGKYALLVESTTNEYVNGRQPCDTMKVGQNLDSKGYGVATPLDSPWRDAINIAVLRLIDYGELAKLENKWWSTNSECKEVEESKASEMLLSNVAGIFYILIAGLVLAMAVALTEFCCKSKTEAKRAKTTHMDAMKARARMTISGTADVDGSKYYTPAKHVDGERLTNSHTHV